LRSQTVTWLNEIVDIMWPSISKYTEDVLPPPFP
jgi:hypothetical protein